MSIQRYGIRVLEHYILSRCIDSKELERKLDSIERTLAIEDWDRERKRLYSCIESASAELEKSRTIQNRQRWHSAHAAFTRHIERAPKP